MPAIAVASYIAEVGNVAVAYCQVQRNRTVAARHGIGLVCGCVGRSRVGIAVPGVAVAHVDGLYASVAVAHIQVQCYDAVAAYGVRQRVCGRIGRLCKCLSAPGVAAAVARHNLLCCCGAVLHCQVQVSRTVTSYGIGQQMGRRSCRGGVGVAIPRVAVAGRL